MELTALTIATALILFVCTSVRSAIGFGDALLAMPLLGMIMSLRTATPVVAFTGFIISLIILVFDQDSVDLKSAWRLIIGTIIGVPFGLLLLQYAPEKLIKVGLGIILILYGLYNLASPKFPQLHHERYAIFFGFVAGILGGAYNTNGPPIAIYGVLRRWSATYFRATMQCYFLFSGIATIAGHGLAGLWTPLVWRLFLWSVPGISIGIYIGSRINRIIPQPMFNQIIFGLLVVVGCIFLL
ncbi:sulfite exporter TauE/SafE family protein [Leptolyngbya sp. AN03gr2]|uniref:sulfite exporter TauE/SafE family protein n=1 Tax=unclassified Leptolyngbya TaxID=2650499 RepID=UPI003D3208AB